MSARVAMGVGIGNGKTASIAATDWQCFIKKAAKEIVFEAWVERDDSIYSFIVNHFRFMNFSNFPVAIDRNQRGPFSENDRSDGLSCDWQT